MAPSRRILQLAAACREFEKTLHELEPYDAQETKALKQFITKAYNNHVAFTHKKEEQNG